MSNAEILGHEKDKMKEGILKENDKRIGEIKEDIQTILGMQDVNYKQRI